MRDTADLTSAADMVLAPTMQPLAFAGLFGWLHQAPGAVTDTGVVLISPLGRDARCAHLPMRLLADQLAGAGFATLRYDHRGEGDSLGLDDPDANALPGWLDDIDAAINQLRALTGVRRVVLGGVRLGATLAALKADRADGLLLLAPVLNGRAWLRRLRFSTTVSDKTGRAGAEDLTIDAGGLYLSSATAAALDKIDLEKTDPAPRPVFVAAQNRMVGAYANRLLARESVVTTRDFPGFEAMFLDAHSNLPPVDLFNAARGWMAETFGPRHFAATTAALPIAELRPPAAIERPVTFGDGLHGILCRPDHDAPNAPAVLFCNTGGDPRAGIGGFATLAARRLAERGATSLRFDFAGLGDSPMRGADLRSHVFDTPREADLEAAVTLLSGISHQRIAMVGVCAGAYHALNLPARDARVSGAFAVSPVTLVWRTGNSLVFGRKDDGKATQAYLGALRDPATWRRLLNGGVDVPAIARTVGHRVTARLHGLAARLKGLSPLNDMKAVAARGGSACLIMGLDDASLDEVEIYFGPRGAKLSRLPGMTVHIDPRIDHGLARGESRRIALNALMDWLDLTSV